MSVPFFNENPLLQFEQNNIISNYLEIENERNLSIFSNPELENKWVLYSSFFFQSFNFVVISEKKKNKTKLQRQLHFIVEPFLEIQFFKVFDDFLQIRGNYIHFASPWRLSWPFLSLAFAMFVPWCSEAIFNNSKIGNSSYESMPNDEAIRTRIGIISKPGQFYAINGFRIVYQKCWEPKIHDKFWKNKGWSVSSLVSHIQSFGGIL